ncbi:aldo/keto reductase [Histomonas meleagridis]|uniref:aldo/keto reductase n=1 Tax=Histomonas meleagridis TaxID=135588 RepID=UPI003559E7B8|nr:aldo/keto reductase [Histomonas meleagridis]KAH0806439.1 aldo/keto reductase [Histomonas meleagridis]
MPLLGFGVYLVTDLEECEKSVLFALKSGYRMIDTAAVYGNEKAVGKAIKESGIPREEIFIVSKVWIQDADYEKTKQSFAKTLENLQTNYLDLYLIHMPYGDYHGSWRAMEELYSEGKIRAIGVSNFLEDRLVDLVLTHKIVPAVNQVELHPFFQQKSLRKVMEKYQIKPMAWGPLAQGKNDIFKSPILNSISEKYHKTPAQVILRWLIQSQIIAIPKSVHENRIQENININDFNLSDTDIEQIEQMDTGKCLILNITSLEEVYRLHGMHFEQ